MKTMKTTNNGTSMPLEIIWPLKFVLVRKVAPGGMPVNPAADPGQYHYGALGATDSLPSGYWLVGWLLRAPSVGQPVYVLRVARNGAVVPGCFVSSEVVAVPSEREFYTMNSIYQWEEIGITPGLEADYGPSATANEGNLL